jgi:hypothetical protein
MDNAWRLAAYCCDCDQLTLSRASWPKSSQQLVSAVAAGLNFFRDRCALRSWSGSGSPFSNR